MTPLLSILTPAVPSRFEQLQKLCAELQKQIRDRPVEHLVLLDNKRRSVGLKRDALLRSARGEYVAFVDDDDMVSPYYVSAILAHIDSAPDVITFDQLATVDGVSSTVNFRLGEDNQPFCPRGITHRAAWHVCAWRRSLAIQSRFPDTSYGEDWAFAAPLNRIAEVEVHIPQILHYYRHSSKTTEAPAPSPNVRTIDTPATAS